MFQKVETYILEDRDVAAIVNMREGTEFETYDIVWALVDEQEYDSNCYVRINLSDAGIRKAKDQVEKAKADNEDESYINILNIYLMILTSLRPYIPNDIGFVFMHISY